MMNMLNRIRCSARLSSMELAFRYMEVTGTKPKAVRKFVQHQSRKISEDVIRSCSDEDREYFLKRIGAM